MFIQNLRKNFNSKNLKNVFHNAISTHMWLNVLAKHTLIKAPCRTLII